MLIALTSILLLTYFGPMVDPKLDAVGWISQTATLLTLLGGAALTGSQVRTSPSPHPLPCDPPPPPAPRRQPQPRPEPSPSPNPSAPLSPLARRALTVTATRSSASWASSCPSSTCSRCL